MMIWGKKSQTKWVGDLGVKLKTRGIKTFDYY